MYINYQIVGYGTCYLPNKAGTSQIKFHTWVPKGGLIDEAYSFFVGSSMALKSTDLLAKDISQRYVIESKGSADVIVECSVIFRNLASIGVVKEQKKSVEGEI